MNRRVLAAPSARLQLKRQRPWGSAVSLVLHLGILALVVAGAADEFLAVRPLGGVGPRGGGGGGTQDVAFISLPPAPPPSALEPAVEEAVQAPVPEVEPETILPATDVAMAISQPVATRQVDVSKILGVGAGTAGGPGSGPGRGGGTGAGVGTGVGDSVGPGTGGEGGTGVPPRPRQVVLPPFEDVPTELRRTQIVVTFWVRENGRVERIAVEPEIRDRKYRGRFREKMMAYRFDPALDSTGVAVASTISIPIQF